MATAARSHMLMSVICLHSSGGGRL